jgi:hypothetical protein
VRAHAFPDRQPRAMMLRLQGGDGQAKPLSGFFSRETFNIAQPNNGAVVGGQAFKSSGK